MTNHQFKSFHITALFLGLLLFPFLGFSQQEEPKRVSVVVTVKEIAPQKEVVQIPADNTPKSVNKPVATKFAPKSTKIAAKKLSQPVKIVAAKPAPMATAPKVVKNITKESLKTPKAVTKPAVALSSSKPKTEEIVKRKPAEVKEKIRSATPPPQKTVPNLPKTETKEIAKSKPTEVKKEIQPTAPPVQKTVANPPKPEAKTVAIQSNKVSTPISDKNTTAVKAEIEKREVPEIPNNVKANAFSYIWIGIFLVVAGVVLGLLFGKPAFLISFVGMVFIALGIII